MRAPVPLLAGVLLAWTAVVAAAPPALEEVVVTATLLPMAAARIPASVTVLDSRDLAESAVQHLEEVLPQVPSLSWAGASSRPRYFQLRGVGELEQYQGAPNPSVGLLVDEIDFSGIGMVATLFDVDQVEVLRGPQGTRYGANAIAGLIKVRTRDAVPRRELDAEVSAGQDGLWSVGAVAGGGLYGEDDPRGAWRLAVQQSRSNGFRHNDYLGRDDTNVRDELTARGKVRLAAADEWRADLTVLHVDLANGYDAFAVDNSYTTLSDRPGRDSQRSTGASIDFRYLGWQGLELASVTSVADSDIEASFDGDWGNERDWGSAGPYDFFSRTLRNRRTISEDLRLARAGQDGTRWIAGAWMQRLAEDNDQHDDGLYLADSFERTLSSRYRATSAALYGQAEAELPGSILFAAGMRAEQRDADYEDTDGAGFGPRDRMWGGQLSLTRELAARQRAYLSLSRGYKAGGFNIGASIPADRLQFAPEYLWSLEAGYKGQWPERGLETAVSAFYMRRLDQQVATSFQLDPQDPLTFVYYTDNAAKGRALGLEGQLSWTPSTAWQFSASASLMKSRYEDYSYGERVLDGRDWAHAPHYKVAAAATWRHPAGWMARIDASAEDAFYFDASNDQRSSAYALVNLRAGYARERWSVEGWLRNALDRRYAVRGFYFGNEPPAFEPKLYVRLGDPRQAGITVRFSY